MAKLELKNINKIYPNGVQAVFDFNLTVEDGEFIVLVGPSGCGKSTTLRMIAGLEGISSGDFLIDGDRVNNKAPVDRDIAMVFQSYALYPNLTVHDNMGISMTLKNEDELVIHDKVKEASESLSLNDYLNRYPANLSGGQRQRVALGRTIVRDPKVFLMDEPLSNLDAKLRAKTRSEIVLLQKKLNVTTIYVTHDQIEAMSMADRIVVMKDGRVQQIDTPYNIFHYPVNMFVGGFIGLPPMNFLTCSKKANKLVCGDKEFVITNEQENLLKNYENKELVLGIRPENIVLSANKYNNCFDVEVDYVEFLGKEYYFKFLFNDQVITATISGKRQIRENFELVSFEIEKCLFFDKDTEMRIMEVQNEEN